jgi:hypothetical protein
LDEIHVGFTTLCGTGTHFQSDETYMNFTQQKSVGKVLEWEVLALFLCQLLMLDSRCLQKKTMFQFWKMRKNWEMTSTYQSWLQIVKGLLYEPSLNFHSSTHCHVNQTGTHTHTRQVRVDIIFCKSKHYSYIRKT